MRCDVKKYAFKVSGKTLRSLNRQQASLGEDWRHVTISGFENEQIEQYLLFRIANETEGDNSACSGCIRKAQFFREKDWLSCLSHSLVIVTYFDLLPVLD